jgi:cob(I)alamin adenosyltransferase
MKIYTKTGDDGSTSLYDGSRVAKSSLRVDTYGTVDELNSIIGIACTFLSDEKLKNDLKTISNWLFNLGSDLATPLDAKIEYTINRIEQYQIDFLEAKIDEYTDQLPPLKGFILPGGSSPAAFLHQARTTCRRAERLAVRLAGEEKITEESVKFLNRLSDYFFTAARYANKLENKNDILWTK